MNQNTNAIRDAKSLGIPKMLLLGLQHMFAMFGATILVPIISTEKAYPSRSRSSVPGQELYFFICVPNLKFPHSSALLLPSWAVFPLLQTWTPAFLKI